jgi:hypothetical protein
MIRFEGLFKNDSNIDLNKLMIIISGLELINFIDKNQLVYNYKYSIEKLE